MLVPDAEQIEAKVREFLTVLLELGKFDLKFQIRAVKADPEAPELIVDFSGLDTDLLLSHGGELLEALEDVTIRFLRLPVSDRGRIAFDSQDYKLLRFEELRLTAETAAERVVKSGAPFSLNPMNSRDRRIVHLSLKENTAVRTESQGAGPYRKV